MKPKIKKRYLILIGLLALFFLGPRSSFVAVNPTITALDVPLVQLDQYIQQKESKFPDIKANNEAHIIWANGLEKTPYSIVYLHGFSASQMEGAPIHKELAKRYGCNLYLSRLAKHGRSNKVAFGEITPFDFVESAKEAIAIGQLIGEKVIVLSCSTGGTLSAYLAAHNPNAIAAQIMYSPNIKIRFPAANLLTMPWGKQLLNVLIGKERVVNLPPSCYPYWTITYPSKSLIALQNLIEQTMIPATFSKIKQPTFLGFYYKNEKEKDSVISIDAIHNFYTSISTPVSLKQREAFPNGTHVLCSDLQSNDLDNLREKTFNFVEKVLKLKEVKQEKIAAPY